MLTQECLKDVLHYEPTTGVFVWLKSSFHKVKVGDVAGCTKKAGYIHISIAKKKYQAHRLAFLCMTGAFPIHQVDHINGIRDDNRWCNLRDVTNQENSKNCRISTNSSSGFNGVSWDKSSNKWRVRIKVNGNSIHLGLFEFLLEAIAARKAANVKYEFHENHGGK